MSPVSWERNGRTSSGQSDGHSSPPGASETLGGREQGREVRLGEQEGREKGRRETLRMAGLKGVIS